MVANRRGLSNIIGALLVIGLVLIAVIILAMYFSATARSVQPRSSAVIVDYVDARLVSDTSDTVAFQIALTNQGTQLVQLMGVQIKTPSGATINPTCLSTLGQDIKPQQTISFTCTASISGVQPFDTVMLIIYYQSIDGTIGTTSYSVTINPP